MEIRQPSPPLRADRDPRLVAYVVLAVLSSGVALFTAVAILITRERFLKLFIDFGVENQPPALWFAGPLIPLLLIALAIATLLKEFVPSLRVVSVLWNAVVLLGSLGTLGLYVVSMFGPLMTLIRSLQ